MIPGIGLTGADSSMAAPGFLASWLNENGIHSEIRAVSGAVLPGFFRGFEIPDRRGGLLKGKQARQWAKAFYRSKEDSLRYAFLFEDPVCGNSVAVTNGFVLNCEGMVSLSDESREEAVQTAAGTFYRKKVFPLCGRSLTPCYSQGALDCALNLMGADRMLTFCLKSGGKPEARVCRRDPRHMTVMLYTSGWRPGREAVCAQLGGLLDSVRQDCYDFLYF